jgi:uncharacterized protein (TIGR02118 family)
MRLNQTDAWMERPWESLACQSPANSQSICAAALGRATLAMESSMVKFMVVLYRRPDLSAAGFAANLRQIHGPMAERLPGLRRYVQNHVATDPSRPHPGWDAIVELYWDDRASMEAAWRSPEGQAGTEHLQEFVDLSRSSWAIVEEEVRRD